MSNEHQELSFTDELLEEAKREENPDRAYDITIPGHVLNISPKKLRMKAKTLYGVIRSLTRKMGYCWATNDYLAQLMECTGRSVQVWIAQLKACDVIVIQEFTNGFYTRRKIWLSEQFKISFSNERPFTPPRTSVHPEEEYKNGKKKKVYKEKPPRQARQPAAAHISLNKENQQFEGITPQDIKNWETTFSAVNARKELNECRLWALSNYRKNYRRSIDKWMSNVNKSNTTPYTASTAEKKPATTEEVEENKKMARKWESSFQGKGGIHYAVNASSNKITFILPNNESFSVSYEINKEEFIKLCRPAIKRMSLSIA